MEGGGGGAHYVTPSQMFLVSVPRIFKMTMKTSCGETTSKVAFEISAFYNFVESSITLSLVCFEK